MLARSVVTRVRLRLRLWPTLAVLFLLAIALGLGFWQLDRARTKTLRQQAIVRYQQAPAINLTLGKVGEIPPSKYIPYRRIKAYGKFLPEHVVFLENRYYKGRPGFYVLMVPV